MTKCNLYPKNGKGEASRLFKELQKKYGREEAVFMYDVAHSDAFKLEYGDWENDLANAHPEILKYGEPTVAMVEKVMNDSYFDFPDGTEPKKDFSPKFAALVEIKSQELKSHYSRLSQLQTLLKSRDNAQDKASIRKSIQVVSSEIEHLQNEISDISRLNALDELKPYAEEHMNVLRRIRSKQNIKESDLIYASRIVKLWKKVADFSGSEHLFFDEEELEEIGPGGALESVADQFKRWGKEAEDFERQFLIPMTKKILDSEMQKDFDQKASYDPNKFEKDISFHKAQSMDVSVVDDSLVQAVHTWVKKANQRAHLEARKLFKKLDELGNKISRDDIKLLKQRVSNDSNLLTGNIVKRFSNTFTEKKAKLKHALENKLEAIIRTRNGRVDLMIEHYKKYYDKRREIEIALDPRKLFEDKDLYAKKTFTEEEKQAHIAELKEHLGEEGYREYYEKAKKKINDYRLDLSAKSIELKAKYEQELAAGDTSMYERELIQWMLNNSPYYAAEFLEEGYMDSPMEGMISHTRDEAYLETVPRRFVQDQNGVKHDTSLYDKRFEEIQQNEHLYEYYKYVTSLMEQFYQSLPGYKTKEIDVNYLPEIERTVIEAFLNDNSAKALQDAWDNIAKALRSTREEFDEHIDPVSGKALKELQLGLLKSPNKRINDYIQRKRIEAIQNKENISPEKLDQWRNEIRDQIAREKSWDITKVTKAFGMASLTFKYKSMIEDKMRLAELGLNVKTEGLKNIQAMIDYFMDVAFYGYPKYDDNGKLETTINGEKKQWKAYTVAEKRIKSEIEQMLQNNEEQHEMGLISDTVYKSTKEILQEQLDNIGGVRSAVKYGDLVLKYIQIKGLGYNVNAAFANLSFGFISNLIEAAGGEHYNEKELMEAMFILRHSVLKNLGIAKHNTTAVKIATLMEKLDVLTESRNELYANSTTVNPLKITQGKLHWLDPYDMQGRTEYINQAALMIAMMKHHKVRVNGKEMSLWNAYDENGEIVEGAEFSQEDELNFKVAVDKVVKYNHGNYDHLSSPIMMKKSFFGRALIQFRAWAIMGFFNRFGGEYYDYQLGSVKKGRYRSIVPAAIALAEMYKDEGAFEATAFVVKQLLRKMTFGYYNPELGEVKGLSEIDKINMKKNLTELMLYATIIQLGLLLRAAVGDLDDDDDKTKQVAFYLLNQLTRSKTDILFYISPIQFENLQRNALPVFNVVVDLQKTINSGINLITGGDDILKSGPNKGQSRFMRDLMKNIPGPTQYLKLQAATHMLYSHEKISNKSKKKHRYYHAGK